MTSPPVIRPSAPRILVRGMNWLGDAVMTTPALLRLREKFPGAHLALVTPEKLKDLWLFHPAVDEIISILPQESVFAVGARLKRRAGDFDVALVLPNSPRSALEVYLAGIPQRIGYARPWRNWFLTHALAPRPGALKMRKRSEPEIRRLLLPDQPSPSRLSPIPESAHQMQEYLHLVAALGATTRVLAPQLTVTADEIQCAKAAFHLNRIAVDTPVFGVNAGAEYGPAKRWPIDRFSEATQEIQKRTGCAWIIFGGKGDLDLAARLAAGLNHEPSVFNLAGRTSLRQLMALLKACRVVLTNDTGPMHVAAALGTPVVVPFGSTSPELTGPGLPGNRQHCLLKADVACSPCFLRECPIDFRCMLSISVAQVVEAMMASYRLTVERD